MPPLTSSRGENWFLWGRSRVLCGLLAAALATPAAPLAAQVNLPALGDAGAEDLSVGQERRLGEQIMREVFRDPAYLDDPVLLEYVQSIWRPLVAEARRRGDIEPGVDRQLSWDTFLVRDRSVNAFALPGGWVGVHLGLISLTGSADELASVMAHELSHVSQRHIARSVGNAQRVSLLGLGAMILGILAAGRSSNPDVASAAIAGGQAAAQQGQLNFSRDMEREADRIGFGLLRGAGFDPRGMSAMFEKLDAANRINDGSAFPYLRSHPLTVERTSEARSRTLLEAGGPPGSTLLHALMQARARVLMDDAVDHLRRLAAPQALPESAPLADRLAQGYAAALANSRLRQAAAAERWLAEARGLAGRISAGPAQTWAHSVGMVLTLAEAELRLAAGQAQQAAALVTALSEGDDSSRPARMLAADAAWAMAHATPAAAAAIARPMVESLQTWVAVRPRDALAWRHLAELSTLAGLPLRAIRAAGEERYALGDLGGAIDRLRAARRQPAPAGSQDFIELSIIDARLRDIEGQRRQLEQEARAARGGRQDGSEGRGGEGR